MVYCWNLRKSLKYRPTNFINLFHVGTFLGSFDLMSIGMDKKNYNESQDLFNYFHLVAFIDAS